MQNISQNFANMWIHDIKIYRISVTILPYYIYSSLTVNLLRLILYLFLSLLEQIISFNLNLSFRK